MTAAERPRSYIEPSKEIFNVYETVALVLTGGRGMRLQNKGYDDLDKWPKLLIDIPYISDEFNLDRATMLDHTLLELRRNGFNNFVTLGSENSHLVNMHVDAFYGPDKTVPVNLRQYVGGNDEGTARAIYQGVVGLDIGETFFVTPADILFPHEEIPDAIQDHKSKGANITWILTSNVPDNAQNKGKIFVNNNREIKYVLEGEPESEVAEHELQSYTSGGIVIIEPDYLKKCFPLFLEDNPEFEDKPVDLWRHLIKWAVKKGDVINSYIIDKPALDLGEVERLEKAGGL